MGGLRDTFEIVWAQPLRYAWHVPITPPRAENLDRARRVVRVVGWSLLLLLLSYLLVSAVAGWKAAESAPAGVSGFKARHFAGATWEPLHVGYGLRGAGL